MKQAYINILAFGLLLALQGCENGTKQAVNADPLSAKNNIASRQSHPLKTEAKPNPGKLIHVIVALCDNQYQGIVPVPQRIGNGDDPANNLYWGAGYGVKNFLQRSKDWVLLLDKQNPKPAVLERCIFKHKDQDIYLVADAYRGREIRQSTIDFLEFASGRSIETVAVNANSKQFSLNVGGGADLIAYVGHDGLMDFALTEYPQKSDNNQRAVIILACASKAYFEKSLRQTGSIPLLWTTGLMAPETYVLKAAIDGWILNETGEKIRRRAATVYNQYQHCGLKSAMNLFSSGW